MLQYQNALICCALKSAESLLKELLLTELLKNLCFYRTWNSSPYSKSHLNVLHTLHLISLRYLSILFSHLRIYLPNGTFFQDFRLKSYKRIIPMESACLLQLMVLALTTIMTSGEEYKSWRQWLQYFLPLSIPSFSVVQIFSSALCSQTPSILALSLYQRQSFSQI
jgi:hypothetical protein